VAGRVATVAASVPSSNDGARGTKVCFCRACLHRPLVRRHRQVHGVGGTRLVGIRGPGVPAATMVERFCAGGFFLSRWNPNVRGRPVLARGVSRASSHTRQPCCPASGWTTRRTCGWRVLLLLALRPSSSTARLRSLDGRLTLRRIFRPPRHPKLELPPTLSPDGETRGRMRSSGAGGMENRGGLGRPRGRVLFGRGDGGRRRAARLD
jgi:hypothetical protein